MYEASFMDSSVCIVLYLCVSLFLRVCRAFSNCVFIHGCARAFLCSPARDSWATEQATAWIKGR